METEQQKEEKKKTVKDVSNSPTRLVWKAAVHELNRAYEEGREPEKTRVRQTLVNKVKSNTIEAQTKAVFLVGECILKGITNQGAIKDSLTKNYKSNRNITSPLIEYVEEKFSPRTPEAVTDKRSEPNEKNKTDAKELKDLTGTPNETGPKNIIIYGVPGVGKTYSVYERAINIVKPDFTYDNRKELIRKFKELQKLGNIEFVTFHQSYSYEEFIEGYRYDKEEKIPTVESGVFKLLVEKAKSDKAFKNPLDVDFSNTKIYKMSLGDTSYDEDTVYEYCIQKNLIALRHGKEVDYEGAKSKDEIKKIFKEKDKEPSGVSTFNPYSKIKINLEGLINEEISMINYFKNLMKIGDLVFVSNGNKKLRAVGKVKGDYFYDSNSPINFNHFREVEWIIKDVDIPVEKLMNKRFSQRTIYEINPDRLIKENIQQMFARGEEKKVRNYVIIIDEINRGNISKIFGELLTLIEDDKRQGRENELAETLPYSGERFSVPENLYIIGTMNTTDRSIALLDIALRRRFKFEEIEPDSGIIEDELNKKGVSPDFVKTVKKVFDILNMRIATLLDKDHRIGHSYFLNINKENSQKDLHGIWYDKAIPLLQEYFYNDRESLSRVLGEAKGDRGFVKKLEEYKRAFPKDEDFEGYECPFEIKKYSSDNFSDVLKRTFLSRNEEK